MVEFVVIINSLKPFSVISVNLIDSILSKPESDNLFSSQKAGLSLEFQL